MRTRKLVCLTMLVLGGGATGLLSAATPLEVARSEYDEIMAMNPNLENGRKAYLTCSVCHSPEGWGTPDGNYPQIAGQLRTVIIKQLADIRARNRENPLMYPFSLPATLGGSQEVADVAAYVAQLPMTPHNGVGPGNDLELGKQLFEDNCVKCHGKGGEGDSKGHVPAIAGQHFNYLVREFEMIRTKMRKNADADMVKQIERFSPREESSVLDYTSRLRPPATKLAKDGWRNPDFPDYHRSPVPELPSMPPIPAMPEPPPIPEPPTRRARLNSPPAPPLPAQ